MNFSPNNLVFLPYPQKAQNLLKDREDGFTLVELLFVAVLFAIMSTILFGTLRSIIKTQNIINDKMLIYSEVQQLFGRMITELSSRTKTAVRSRPTQSDGVGTIAPGAPFILGYHVREGSIDKDILRFVASGQGQATFGENANFGDVQIEYRLEEQESGTSDNFTEHKTYRLVREESPAGITDVDSIKKHRLIVTLSNKISSMRFRYFGGKSRDRGWRNEWQNQGPRLPEAIEISLSLVTADGQEHSFRTATSVEKSRVKSGDFRNIGGG